MPWDDVQKATFLQAQFAAQHRYYQEHYPNAAFDIILVDGAPAGRRYVNHGAEELRIVDIALTPAYRGRGIGSHLIGQLQKEAAERAVPLTIHVERFNPALQLYQRLGFIIVEDKGVYLLMQWKALARSNRIEKTHKHEGHEDHEG